MPRKHRKSTGPRSRQHAIPKSEEPITVLFQGRPDVFSVPGGDTVLMVKLKRALTALGVHVDYSHIPQCVEPYDLVHIFNPISAFARNAVEQSTPFVVTPLYEDVHRYTVRSRIAVNAFREYLACGESKTFQDRVGLLAGDEDRGSGLSESAVLLGAAEAVLATGEYERNCIREDFPQSTSVQVLPLGFSRPERQSEVGPDFFVSRYGVRDFVLCVGRLETRKNQLMLLYALRELDVPLVFINGETKQPAYEELCRSFPRRGKTIFTGPVSEEMLFSAYRAARVHVLPSWFELPGLVSLEAGWTGCNVVTGSWGTTREYMGDDAFYCEPNDPESIRKSVEEALRLPPVSGLKKRLEGWTWERHAEGVHKIYRTVKRRSGTAGVRKRYRRWVNKVKEEKQVEGLIQQASDGLAVHPGGAEQLATRVINLRPRSAQGAFVRGKARLSLMEYKGAASDFLHVTQVQPDHSPAAYLFLALSLLVSSEYEAVLQTLENLSSVFSLEADGMAEVAAEYRDKALAGIEGKTVSVENKYARKTRRPSEGKSPWVDERELSVP